MTSKYRLVIIREDGNPVFYMPGSKGERDMVNAIVEKVMSKGVGFFRTESHVRKDVVEAVNEVIHDLKAEVTPL